MDSKEDGNIIYVRLYTDEDFFEGLEEACQKYDIEGAVIVSGLGRLKNFELGYYKGEGDYAPTYFEETYEIFSLSGSILKEDQGYDFHIHAGLADEDKEAIGGHLVGGKVSEINDIVLRKTDSVFEH